jgi:3-methyladenine DNA glycosylase Tag
VTVEDFAAIYQRAAERKGGEAALEARVSRPLSAADVSKIDDSRFLAEMTKKVFQSGFVWRVIEQKWPEFEALFFAFEPQKVLLMPDEMLEQRATDKRIVRNFKKVMTIRHNAQMIMDVSQSHGNFARFVSQYDKNQIIDLWRYLKDKGQRLGGNTGPYALRALGIDTFLLTRDVEGYFRQHELISGGLQSKRTLSTFNEVFFHWHQQSGRSLQELSQILAYSCGDNY